MYVCVCVCVCVCIYTPRGGACTLKTLHTENKICYKYKSLVGYTIHIAMSNDVLMYHGPNKLYELRIGALFTKTISKKEFLLIKRVRNWEWILFLG